MHYPVVTICGSMRYLADMLDFAEKLALEESCCVFLPTIMKRIISPLPPEKKDLLRALHFQKIDMSERVYVVCPDNYIGRDTQLEIEYALSKNIPVTYYEPYREHREPD